MKTSRTYLIKFGREIIFLVRSKKIYEKERILDYDPINDKHDDCERNIAAIRSVMYVFIRYSCHSRNIKSYYISVHWNFYDLAAIRGDRVNL